MTPLWLCLLAISSLPLGGALLCGDGSAQFKCEDRLADCAQMGQLCENYFFAQCVREACPVTCKVCRRHENGTSTTTTPIIAAASSIQMPTTLPSSSDPTTLSSSTTTTPMEPIHHPTEDLNTDTPNIMQNGSNTTHPGSSTSWTSSSPYSSSPMQSSSSTVVPEQIDGSTSTGQSIFFGVATTTDDILLTKKEELELNGTAQNGGDEETTGGVIELNGRNWEDGDGGDGEGASEAPNPAYPLQLEKEEAQENGGSEASVVSNDRPSPFLEELKKQGSTASGRSVQNASTITLETGEERHNVQNSEGNKTSKDAGIETWGRETGGKTGSMDREEGGAEEGGSKGGGTWSVNTRHNRTGFGEEANGATGSEDGLKNGGAGGNWTHIWGNNRDHTNGWNGGAADGGGASTTAETNGNGEEARGRGNGGGGRWTKEWRWNETEGTGEGGNWTSTWRRNWTEGGGEVKNGSVSSRNWTENWTNKGSTEGAKGWKKVSNGTKGTEAGVSGGSWTNIWRSRNWTNGDGDEGVKRGSNSAGNWTESRKERNGRDGDKGRNWTESRKERIGHEDKGQHNSWTGNWNETESVAEAGANGGSRSKTWRSWGPKDGSAGGWTVSKGTRGELNENGVGGGTEVGKRGGGSWTSIWRRNWTKGGADEEGKNGTEHSGSSGNWTESWNGRRNNNDWTEKRQKGGEEVPKRSENANGSWTESWSKNWTSGGGEEGSVGGKGGKGGNITGSGGIGWWKKWWKERQKGSSKSSTFSNGTWSKNWSSGNGNAGGNSGSWTNGLGHFGGNSGSEENATGSETTAAGRTEEGGRTSWWTKSWSSKGTDTSESERKEWTENGRKRENGLQKGAAGQGDGIKIGFERAREGGMEMSGNGSDQVKTGAGWESERRADTAGKAKDEAEGAQNEKEKVGWSTGGERNGTVQQTEKAGDSIRVGSGHVADAGGKEHEDRPKLDQNRTRIVEGEVLCRQICNGRRTGRTTSENATGRRHEFREFLDQSTQFGCKC